MRQSPLLRNARREPSRSVAAPARGGGLRWGFALALGAIGAVGLGLALYTVRGIIVTIFLALFITVGLDPLIRLLQRHHFSRGLALLTVVILVVALVITILLVVIPLVVQQLSAMATQIPKDIANLKGSSTFAAADTATNGALGTLLTGLKTAVVDPKVLAGVATGVVGVGLSLVDAISAGFFMLILVLYFVISYDGTKQAAYNLVARSHRDAFTDISDRILGNVGKYLSGQVILAFINSVFSFTILLIAGVPGAFAIGVGAFFVTLIPLVGTVITTCIMTVIAFVHSPVSALFILIAMLIYMQVEAYVFSPKVMSKAVAVPGSLVLISAIAGATLFGLVGALIAIPISAGINLIIREVVMPRKELA